ncbi:MAG: helix-turn-helix domain-containing protein, partial [Candidatus Scatosoma sp.]
AEEVKAYVAPLLALLSGLYLKIKEEKVADNSLYGRCLSYVYENYTGDLSCEKIAAHLHYSASYLRHVFKKKSGDNITDFILRLKLEKSKTLLLSSGFSVTDVAMMSGFNDSNHFSAIFKKHVGVSPRAFRKANGKGNDG